MWIIIYILIGIVYCYLLDMPFYNNIIKSDIEMYLFLVVMDILVFAGLCLYNGLLRHLKRMKWYQLVIGIVVSVISLLVTIAIRFILGMRGM